MDRIKPKHIVYVLLTACFLANIHIRPSCGNAFGMNQKKGDDLIIGIGMFPITDQVLMLVPSAEDDKKKAEFVTVEHFFTGTSLSCER